MAGYARLSNRYWQDKDVLKLRRRNPAAALLHVLAISWCSDHASDGRIDEDTLLYVLGAQEQDVADLVASGMLQTDPDGGEGAYMLRSYLKYQNSADQIEQAREKATERQRRKRERDNAGKADDTTPVTPASDDGHTTVTPVSRRDKGPVTPMSFNQEPITNNQKDFSNEKSLPQTPSRREGAGVGTLEEHDVRGNLAQSPHAIDYERAAEIVRRVGEFYPPVKFRGRSYPQTIVAQSDAIVRAAPPGADIAGWFVERAKAYVDAQSDPRYVTDFGFYLKGGGHGDKLPYWQTPWELMPSQAQQDAQRARERDLRDIDYICTHWRDEDAQRAALRLSEAQQAKARMKYPEEWYKVWRRGKALEDRERKEKTA